MSGTVYYIVFQDERAFDETFVMGVFGQMETVCGLAFLEASAMNADD